MASEFRSGKMEPNTEACGKTTELMAKALSGMPMATNMKANSRMTSQMGTASIHAPMGLYTRVSGSTTSSTGRARLNGQMALVMLEIMLKVSVRELVPTHGPTKTNTAENG